MSLGHPARRVGSRAAAAMALAALAACQVSAPRRPVPTRTPLPPPVTVPGQRPPIDVFAVPDAVPRVEPRSPWGNPPFYDVFGKRYYLRPTCRGYDERGVASWYGPGFYEEQTSTHEPYDMYAMTAAHKTLPLPCYVRVTNLQNGRSVVVRVNDRGPFVKNRIIDLSYTAAAKLGMLQQGTAMVEVRALDPTTPAAPAPVPPPLPMAASVPAAPAPAPVPASTAVSAPAAAAPAPTPLYIQTGAFADPANAERLLRKLRDHGYGDAFVRRDLVGDRTLYRVRIGPVAGVPDYDRIVDELERIGVRGARLAPN